MEQIPIVVWLAILSIMSGIMGWMSRTMYTDMKKSIGMISDRLIAAEKKIAEMDKQIEINSTHDDYVQEKLESHLERIEKTMVEVSKRVEATSKKTLEFSMKYGQSLEILKKKIDNINI